MADDIDDLLRHTMKTLDDQVPSGYFEDLTQRTLGRLEVSLMQTGSDQESSSASATTPPPEEDSGLHDIRSLAQTTKQRISSRKITNNATPDDDVIASSSSGWKAVALPEPAKMISLPDIDDLPPPRKLAEASAVEMPNVTPIDARVKRPTAPAKRRNRTIAIVGVGFAAAAGLVLFVSTRSNHDQARLDEPTVTPSTDHGTTAAKPEGAMPPTAPAGQGKQEIASDTVGTKGQLGGGMTGSAVLTDAGTAQTVTTDKNSEPPGEKPTEKIQPIKVQDVKPTTGKSVKAPVKRSVTKGNIGKPMTKEPPPTSTSKSKVDDTPKAKDDTGKKSKKSSGDDEPSFDDLLKDEKKETKTKKPELDKKSLSGDDFKHGMAAISGKAQGCYKGTAGSVAVRVSIGNDGHVKNVTASGPLAGSPAAACVTAAVQGATFPPWDGPPQSFGYSFLLSE